MTQQLSKVQLLLTVQLQFDCICFFTNRKITETQELLLRKVLLHEEMNYNNSDILKGWIKCRSNKNIISNDENMNKMQFLKLYHSYESKDLNCCA